MSSPLGSSCFVRAASYSQRRSYVRWTPHLKQIERLLKGRKIACIVP